MKCGVQICDIIAVSSVQNAGFDYIELTEDKANDYKENKISGIEISGLYITEDKLFSALQLVREASADYLLINTDNMINSDGLSDAFENAKEMIEDMDIVILIQNGVIGDDVKGYKYGAFSDAQAIIQFVEYGNRLCENKPFKVAVDVGRANLLAKNIPVMIMELKEYVYLLHVNDNDGQKNLMQMPFTFTTGRGAWSTDWNKIWAAVMKCGKAEWIIFNSIGLLKRIPQTLQKAMLELQKAIYDKWMWQVNFEEVLKGRKIVLFGSGGMAVNFIKVWGDRYKPEFIVDNNQSRWGISLLDCEIKSPEKILEIPEDKRLVLICNKYYNEIKTQLSSMGVRYECYNDEFYWFG
ncbi:MAG: hypothetical protein ACI4E1_00570 [Lachnospira sp.]